MKKNLVALTLSSLFFVGCGVAAPEKNSEDIQQAQEELGKALYFDKALSKNRTQSCSTCHNPDFGFVDNRDNGVEAMASLGDDGHSLGDRHAPTAAYAAFSPEFHYDPKKKKFIGGQFWDGREKDLKGQAGGPPTNPVEMGIPDKDFMLKRLQENPYYVEQFQKIYGKDIFKSSEKAYSSMAQAIASFEKTEEFAPFDSKYDRYLKGEYELSDLEDLGMSLFFSNNNTNCSTCHVLKGEDKTGETFTNYEYHNIGVPANKKLRVLNGATEIDKGLLNNPAVTDERALGKYKVPTLRNVAITGPYMHNGVFQDLETVVMFYDKFNNKENKVNPETGKLWEVAEIEKTINTKDLKMKKLTERKVKALVAFMETLTDKRYEHLLKKR